MTEPKRLTPEWLATIAEHVDSGVVVALLGHIAWQEQRIAYLENLHWEAAEAYKRQQRLEGARELVRLYYGKDYVPGSSVRSVLADMEREANDGR